VHPAAIALLRVPRRSDTIPTPALPLKGREKSTVAVGFVGRQGVFSDGVCS